ncbi:unnamed protein product [Brassica oleracea var. botrytis]
MLKNFQCFARNHRVHLFNVYRSLTRSFIFLTFSLLH